MYKNVLQNKRNRTILWIRNRKGGGRMFTWVKGNVYTLVLTPVSYTHLVHLDAKILNGETAVLFAYPLDDHTLLLNQTYLIEFHK